MYYFFHIYFWWFEVHIRWGRYWQVSNKGGGLYINSGCLDQSFSRTMGGLYIHISTWPNIQSLELAGGKSPIYINPGCSGYSVVEAGRGAKVRGQSRGFWKVRTLAECNYCHLKRTALSTDLSLCINPTFGASRGEKLKAMTAFQQLCLHGKSKKSQ